MEMETLLSSKINIVQKENYNSVILTDEALAFLESLHQKFNSRRIALIKDRSKRQLEIDKGIMPYFLPETKIVRDGNWKVADIPHDLQDRRVEITGPVSRKMIINALNSGAKTFMADFEDSSAPTWNNVIDGQQNLKDAVDGTISFHKQGSDKVYTLNEETAVLMVRPRAWHLDECHIEVNGKVMSGALVDFGLYFFHNVKLLLAKGTAPYFYLPKMESHLEARLWNDVFVYSQEYLKVPQQTIRSTVLIETIMAAFEMDEILYELKDHIAGLNCGRWDYIFSFIKRLRMHSEFLLSDRDLVGMSIPFMKNYSLLLIQTCHKRGASAIGGMAAQIPIKDDDKANRQALDKVVQDKMREVKNGHDGTWVAHPALVSVAQNVFDAMMPAKNQIEVLRSDVSITEKDLLELPELKITEAGVRKNINVGILYLNAWLMGNGAAAIYHLMEDAATAEISRAQIWQWIKHGAVLTDGRKIDEELVQMLLPEELDKIKDYVGDVYYKNARFPEAITLFDELVYSDEFEEFLTLKAYPKI
jgi:malate synthase